MTSAGPAERVAEVLDEHGLTIAVAESLTGGLLANHLARAGGASAWLRGGVVAYAVGVKRKVLDVPPGPVVSEQAATTMASSVAGLLDADIGVAVTGVGGPDEQDGIPPGTVWFGVWTSQGTLARLAHFDGDPGAVCDQTCETALALVLEHLAATSEVSSGASGDGTRSDDAVA